MKRIFFALITFALLFCLASCTGDGAPEGMQMVNDSADEGYCFYVPEEWVVANTGKVKAAYVSNLDTTSVTFTEISPESFKKDADVTDEVYFFEKYFDDSKAEFPKDTEYTLIEDNSIFGANDAKPDRAKKYTYKYIYANHEFGFMQIFLMHGGRFYIFTYSALLEKKTDDMTHYDYFLEKLGTVIDNFKFTEKKDTGTAAKEYERDSDGYILASEKKLAGFELYIPDSYSVDYASAIVSATKKDGTNITMTKVTAAGMYTNEYWTLRKTELSAIVGELTEVKEPIYSGAAFGNAKDAAAFEYTYTYGGEKYHVLQYLAIKGLSGYVFTFTAKDSQYAAEIGEIEKVIEKVVF